MGKTRRSPRASGRAWRRQAPTRRCCPRSVDNNDVELQNDIYLMLRNNSETANLTDITVRVHNGLATLLGTAPTTQDIAILDEMISDMEGVFEVQNRLEVAE